MNSERRHQTLTYMVTFKFSMCLTRKSQRICWFNVTSSHECSYFCVIILHTSFSVREHVMFLCAMPSRLFKVEVIRKFHNIISLLVWSAKVRRNQNVQFYFVWSACVVLKLVISTHSIRYVLVFVSYRF